MSAAEQNGSPVEEQSRAFGGDLRLALSCPKCGVTGWVKLTSLNHGIHCPKCKAEFMVGRTGQMVSLVDQPQTRFTCPRCGKSGSVPSNLGIRRAACASCKLPLVAGPDQKLHGVKEAEELNRQAIKAKPAATWRSWLEKEIGARSHRAQTLFVTGVVTLVLAALCGLGFAVAAILDDSPEKSVRRFTQLCLRDDGRAAGKLLVEDDIQKSQFERWQIMHFASIIDKHRPHGDSMKIEVEPRQVDGERGRFKVTLTSEFVGARSHEQVWRRQDGQWRFDAFATLGEPTRPARTAPVAAQPEHKPRPR